MAHILFRWSIRHNISNGAWSGVGTAVDHRGSTLRVSDRASKLRRLCERRTGRFGAAESVDLDQLNQRIAQIEDEVAVALRNVQAVDPRRSFETSVPGQQGSLGLLCAPRGE